MRFFKRTDFLSWGIGLILLLTQGCWAEGITARQAEIHATDEGYFLDASFDVELTPALEEALTKGVPLSFSISVDVIQPRWYWFNREVVALRQERRISFNPLTRVFRFSIGSLYLNFNTLKDALQSMAQLNKIRIADPGAMKRGDHYEVRTQMKLDVSQLPKPFQIDALSSNDWNLTSKAFTWTFTP